MGTTRPDRQRLTSLAPMLGLLLSSMALTPSTVLGEQWIEVRSPSFHVLSNASERKAQRVAREFEEIRRAISLWFPGLQHDPATIRIYALATTDQMAEFADMSLGNTVGFFRKSDLGGEIVLGLDVDTQTSFGVLYHEYFHSVTRHSLPGLPLWLNEGLAEIWGNSTIGEKKIQIGIVNRNYMRFLGQTKLVPLEELLDPDRAAAAYIDRERRSSFYAQAWALTHYFMMGDGGSRWPRLLQYLELCANGHDEEEVWLRIFGERKEVTKDLWKYLNGRRFSSRILDTASDVDLAAYPVRTLSKAEADAHRGAFHTRGRNRDLAAQLLADATAESGPAFAHEARGVLALRQGDVAEARRQLETAVSLEPERHLTHYHLAGVERDEGAAGWHERAEKHLLQTVQIAPWFGPAHLQLARLYRVVDGSPLRAVVVAKRGLKHSRGDPLAHLLFARLAREAGKHAAEAESSIRFAGHLATVSQSPATANTVCWWGTLYGLADEIYPACEAAVRRAPGSAGFLDSRAVARAARGDLAGAIADFEVVVAAEELDLEIRKERGEWLEQLRKGENPIDDELLEELQLREPR